MSQIQKEAPGRKKQMLLCSKVTGMLRVTSLPRLEKCRVSSDQDWSLQPLLDTLLCVTTSVSQDHNFHKIVKFCFTQFFPLWKELDKILVLFYLDLDKILFYLVLSFMESNQLFSSLQQPYPIKTVMRGILLKYKAFTPLKIHFS